MSQPRPYTILSCAMSLDGYIDDSSAQRLRLSNEADFDRVDEVRAGCDAILVGAGTIRRDNPRLLVRSEERRRRRRAAGSTADLVKVTLTSTGDLDPVGRFFTTGDAAKLVYTADDVLPETAARFAADEQVSVVAAGTPPDLGRVMADLAGRGVRRLLVEGGGGIHTAFLSAGIADELHLAVAPLLIGDQSAPRFVQPAAFPSSAERPMELVETARIGGMAFLRYRLGGAAGV